MLKRGRPAFAGDTLRRSTLFAGYGLAFWVCFVISPGLADGAATWLALCCACSLVAFAACEFGHLLSGTAAKQAGAPGRAACLAFAVAAACAAGVILLVTLVAILFAVTARS